MIRALLPLLAVLSPFAAGAAAGSGGRFPPEVESFLYEERLWPALEAAEKLAAAPGLSPAALTLAWRQAAELRARVGDAPGARADLERALAASPKDARTLLALARVSRERPREALAFASKAGPSPEADRLAGEILLDLGDDRRAAARLERAARARPSDLEALRALARASKDARWARAAESSAQAAPPWLRAAALRLAAAVWLDAGRKPEAKRALKGALAADPRDLDALEALKGLNGEGVEVSTEAAPAPGAAWNDDPLAALREKAPASDAAAELFVDEISRAPTWQRVCAYREAALAWRALGDADKARRCVLLAARLDPGSPATAELRWALGDRGLDAQSALANARNAVESARFDAGEEPLAAGASER